MSKPTGIKLIAQERKEQIEKHGNTVLDDVQYNDGFQLSHAASVLSQFGLNSEPEEILLRKIPNTWYKERWLKMCRKPFEERLTIAGALIAAEIDRLNYLQNGK